MTPEVPPYRRGGGFGSLGIRFSEVLEPAPVSLQPATLGAWLTLALLGLSIVAGFVWLVVRFRRRRHRRVAQRELTALAGALEGTSAREALEGLPSVLKRCALGSFPREAVAPLSGERWLEFLDASCPTTPFAGNAGRALIALTTRGASALGSAEISALIAASRIWVRRHHARV